MLNWKKEGYKVGEYVYIVKNLGLSSNKLYLTGKAVYVGIKKMDVLVVENGKEKILKFNGMRNVNGYCFGYYYSVFKSEEEYNQMIYNEKKAMELREYISSNIKDVSLKELENIKRLIEKDLKK